MKEYRIERMSLEDLHLAIKWAAKEGWNPGLNDAECFYQADPQGFFIGKLGEQIIAMGSAVNYDNQFSFCGLYMVSEGFRGEGYGLELTKARLAYVGNRNAGIDGVISMLKKYQRLGYQIAHNNARYMSNRKYSYEPNPAVLQLQNIDFEPLEKYDRRHFPAPRPQFLNQWIRQKGSLSLGYLSQGELKGYGVIRPCVEGYKIGPLFADNPQIANILFLQLAEKTSGKPFYLDIPENNPNAIALAERYAMKPVFATARMYLKGAPNLEMDQIYGITTLELG